MNNTKQLHTLGKRLDCLICNYAADLNDQSLFATFACNVRAFKGEEFKVWRCPGCKTIHCLEVVDLDHYYAKYPIAGAVAHDSARACYRNLCQRLIKHGFKKTHRFLDYGCGGNGLFVQYLRDRGFTHCEGYDPYSPRFGDPAILQKAPFDYILIQDIIEHVEDPDLLLSKLDGLLAPGGYVYIGTPNANNIDLTQPNVAEYYNEVHVPYHLHMYTRATLELLSDRQGWESVEFFEHPYPDLWFGVNSRAWNQYVRLSDGTIDTIYEPTNIWKAVTSYRFLFYAFFGYWLSFRTSMAAVFRKGTHR